MILPTFVSIMNLENLPIFKTVAYFYGHFLDEISICGW
jgi:hypothetical protein